MNQTDDLRALGKIMGTLLGSAIIILIIHIYWFCYGYLRDKGLTFMIIDQIIFGLQKSIGICSNILVGKLYAIFLLALYCLSYRGVKREQISWQNVAYTLIPGFFLYFFNWWIFSIDTLRLIKVIVYISTLVTGFCLLLTGGIWLKRILNIDLMSDPFNSENESFMQETRLLENEYSVNLRTRFYYNKKWHEGFINVVNIFRGSIVVGSPGSGKSFCLVNQFIKQLIEKGFAMYLYDYKFPDLSLILYNHLATHIDCYKIPPKLYIINFDDPEKSHRCNPIHPSFMEDITDAYEASYTILLNLNKTWIQKQGDFFVESPIILLASIIWYLKRYDDEHPNLHCCTFPHAIEFLNKKYMDIFPILTSYKELENYLSPFMDAWAGGAQDQLQGQIASAKIPLSRMISPNLYWIMTGDDFTLDLNNPQNPKLLCVGNNPDRQNIYNSALGLYNSRIVKLINKKNKLKCGVIIDELPTLYFRGLDNLIATARSNKVGVMLSAQDLSQLIRDYGEKEAKAIFNTIGNVFSGQVLGDTAKNLSERFGKILQRRQSISINQQDTSTSISTQLDCLIPPSKISNLSQGQFVGSVADNFGEYIDQKIFNCEIVIDIDKVSEEEKNYQSIPVITNFIDPKDQKNYMKEMIQENYDQVKLDCERIVRNELIRIAQDPLLEDLLGERDDLEELKNAVFEPYTSYLSETVDNNEIDKKSFNPNEFIMNEPNGIIYN